jgi:WD40 repeat protein
MTPITLILAFALGAEPRLDLYGDPLPDGAVARMGSLQLRQADLSGATVLADGKTLLVSGRDRILRYWNLETGALIRTARFGDGTGSVQSFDVARDGKSAVVIDAGRVTLWDVATNKPGPSFALPNVPRPNLIFWDGKRVAVLLEDSRVILWDRDAGKERTITFPARRFGADSTYHAQLSPDGKWLIGLGGSEQPFCVFDAANGREVHRFTCFATTSAFSPDGKQIVVCDLNNDKKEREAVLRFFDLESGKPVRQFPLGHPVSCYSLVFSPDGKTLVCGIPDRSVVLNAETGQTVFRFPERPLWSFFTPDGKTLVTDHGHRLRVWDMAPWRERFPRPGEFGYTVVLAVSPDGRYLAAGDWTARVVTLWDAATSRWVREMPLTGDERYVRMLEFSSDGKSLVAGQAKGFFQWWDVETGKELRTLQLDNPDQKLNRDMFCYALHLSRDGTHIATTDRTFGQGGEFTRLLRWDAAAGKMLQQRVLPGEFRQCAWSDDGTEILVPLADGLKRMDLTNGQAIWHAAEATDRRLAVSRDGRIAATVFSSPDKRGSVVRIWETAAGMEIARRPLGRVDHFALASDNRHLVTTDVESLHLWDLATGRELVRRALPNPTLTNWGTTAVTALALSPDGRRAFTSMADGTALVWDLAPANRAAPLAAVHGPAALAGWWADLAAADAGKAHAAAWRLAEAPAAAVTAMVRKNLKPTPEPDAGRVGKWIEQLGDPKFEVRQSAHRELEALGRSAFPALRRALDAKPSAEARRRLIDLLAKPKGAVTPDALGGVRAIGVLERLATPDARALLAELARGGADHDLTRAASAALVRLAR